MIINQIATKKYIGKLKRITSHKFSYYQDTPSQKIWESLGGSKDDVFIYNTDAKLVQHLKASPEEDEPGSHMGSGKEKCDQLNSIPVIKTLVEELQSILKNENGGYSCDDDLNQDFEEILARRDEKKMTAKKRHAKKEEKKAMKEMEKIKRQEKRKMKQEVRKMANQAQKEERKKAKEERQKVKEERQKAKEERQKANKIRKENRMKKKEQRLAKKKESEESKETSE